MSDDGINDTIKDKISDATKDRSEKEFCLRVLRKELLNQNSPNYDFKGNFKKWLDELFPFDGTVEEED